VLARWPNIAANGTWQWANVDKVEGASTAFTVNGSAAARALTWPTASTPGGSATLMVTSATAPGAGGAHAASAM
jgi:hypothetical protein